MLYNYDLSILRWLNSFVFLDQRFDSVAVFVAVFLGYWMIAGVLALAVATFFRNYAHLKRKNWELAVCALVAAGVARFGITEIIRVFWNRVRPFETLSDVHQLVFRDGSGSFPSGHAVFYFAIAAVVGRYYPKTSILFYLAAFLISVSRIISGVHWPSDIVAGATIGIVTGFVTVSIAKRFSKTKTVA